MTSFRIRLVVVIYKIDWSRSETLQALINMDDAGSAIDLVIWDNSPVSGRDENIVGRLSSNNKTVSVVECPGNDGLAKVYNSVSHRPGYDVFCIFDQDTHVDEGYFLSLRQAVLEGGADVTLPIVISGGRIVSPGSYGLVKGRHWTRPRVGVLSSKGIVAISSGMAVSRQYIERWPRPFDERLSLYGVDTAFMRNYAKRSSHVRVMDYKIQHEAILWSDPAKSVMLSRFKNLRSARLIMHSDDTLPIYLLSLAYAVWSSVRMAVRYRDLAFLTR